MNEGVLEYVNRTTLHPVGLIAVLVLGVMMLLVPRRDALAPMIVMACFISPAQRIVIATLDFDLLRILVLFGWARVVSRNELRGFQLRGLDWVVLVWALTSTTMFTFSRGTPQALVYQLGKSFDIVGMYFLFRLFIKSWKDCERLVWALAIASIPAALLFALEWGTGRNLFSVLGRVPEITRSRGGRLRCQGPFPHAIIAGCFWASIMPWLVPIALNRATRSLGVIALCMSTWIVFTTGSSTPAMAVVIGACCAAFYPVRANLRVLKYCGVVALVFTHFAMNGPVWSLIAKVNVFSSSTGWHRFNLIDKAIKNVGEWWLLGTENTSRWGYGLHDITNQFVLEGIRGGAATLIAFCVMIWLAFRLCGELHMRYMDTPHLRVVSWFFSVSLCVHCMNFLGVSYFGQIQMLWYLQLAIVASLHGAYVTGGTRAVVAHVRQIGGTAVA